MLNYSFLNRCIGLAAFVVVAFLHGFIAPCSAVAGIMFSEDFSGAAAVSSAYGVGPIGNTGIKVTAGNVDIIGVLGGSNYTCDDNPGGNCLDLVGNVASGSISTIFTFDLAAGNQYTISFGVRAQGIAQDINYFVGLGNFALTLTALASQNQHVSLSYSPVADENDVALVFHAITNLDGAHGAVLDHIVLTETSSVAPEPGTITLLASAFAMIFLGKRLLLKE